VLIVYSLFKRPFILDLAEERSIIRCFLNRGLNVYLVDWRPPHAEHATRGLDAYINQDLKRAVDRIRQRERVDRVSIVGICFGGLLALIYTALYPETVAHLVPVAVGFERRQIIPPMLIEQTLLMNRNVPAWWVSNIVNARVPAAPMIPEYLAAELDEPDIADEDKICDTLAQWINSDLPFAGQLARDIMRDIYWDGQLADGRLRVGDRHISLDQIRCPVLNVSGAKDQLVPPTSTQRMTECLGSLYARNFVFPSSHIGLIASRYAHEELWPRVCMWLKVID
jgi:polyhydroxyalkanoate synthase